MIPYDAQGRQRRMVQQLIVGELDCPRLPWLQPASEKLRQKVAARLTSAKAWYTDRYRLFFICPVTLTLAETNDGKGYEVTLPKKWVSKYGAAIKVTIQVLRIAAATGHIVGLPIPRLPSAKDVISNVEAQAVDALNEYLNMEGVEPGLAEGGMQAFNDAFNEALELDETAVSTSGSKLAALKPVTGAAYRALRELVHKLDPTLQKCGLEKAGPSPDGKYEWVKPDAESRAQFLRGSLHHLLRGPM